MQQRDAKNTPQGHVCPFLYHELMCRIKEKNRRVRAALSSCCQLPVQQTLNAYSFTLLCYIVIAWLTSSACGNLNRNKTVIAKADSVSLWRSQPK